MSASISARYIFSEAANLHSDATLILDDDRIVEVCRRLPADVELGNVAIIPQLVNTHTHLELSGFQEPIAGAGISFSNWIEAIVSGRRGTPPNREDQLVACQQGIAEAILGGGGAIGDIVSSPVADFPWPQEPVFLTRFLELIGLSVDRVPALFESATAYVTESASPELPVGCRRGLSPHAPYTVHPQLLEEVCSLSKRNGFPVAMHLAESPEELELITSRCGPFVEVLDKLEAWDPTAIPRGIDAMFYLEQLAQAHRALVVHGTFLNSREMAFLAQRPHMTVVYCPRTHAYFPHGDYPLAEYLAAGVPVALGTDSRASNPDLSIFEEMKFVASVHPTVSATAILEMGTIRGAQALDCEASLGSLKGGKLPRGLVVALPSGVTDPAAAVLHAESRLTHRIVGTELIPL